MVTESFEVRSGGPGLRALLARAVGVDANASVRLRQLAEAGVDAVDRRIASSVALHQLGAGAGHQLRQPIDLRRRIIAGRHRQPRRDGIDARAAAERHRHLSAAAPGAGGKPIHEWLELRPFLTEPPTIAAS